MQQSTPNEAYGSTNTISTSKGSWLARVSHRASHIQSRSQVPPVSSTAASKDTLSLRAPAGVTTSFDHLPVAQNTGSYPTSPTSPTTTEFAATPFDQTFGDRVEPPPERRAPSVPGRKSRGTTLTQADLNHRGPEEKMDKYARQAGDATYDSDDEADDEFERSVFAPSSAAGDDETDHGTDTEDDHDSHEGEDTPTSQGWTEHDGQSPRGSITSWSEDDVADFVATLGPGFSAYAPRLIDEGINGQAVVALQHDELRELGVNSVGHRLSILKAVYEQKVRAGIKIDEDDYVPLSVEGEHRDMTATQDDITRIIESIRLRDSRIIAAEAELRVMKQDLDRIYEENRKLREETLPIMRLMKDQRTPLPDPSGAPIPSPKDFDKASDHTISQSKGTGLSRKFSAKKIFLNKQPSPTHPPGMVTREVRDDGGGHLEASAAAMAASTHLTASMTSQPSPNSVHGQQLSPTSPAYSSHPASGGPYQHNSSATARSFPRHDQRGYSSHADDTGTRESTNSHWSQVSQASTAVGDASTVRMSDRPKRQPIPSPREPDDGGSSGASKDRDNPQVEIFKSFRVSIDDPCKVVLPVALKRYNITDDWRQYALYIVHGDQERCLGLQEKPLLLFKQLDKEGRKPMFMLRRHASPQEGWSGAAGGGIPQERASTQIPGGVL